MQGMSVGKGVNIEYLVQQSKGVSGAEIKSICVEAGMFAIREESTKVSDKNFVDAITKINAERRNNIEDEADGFV